MIINIITLLLFNHTPLLFVSVFCYLLKIIPNVILNNFLSNFNEHSIEQMLLRLHFSYSVN